MDILFSSVTDSLSNQYVSTSILSIASFNDGSLVSIMDVSVSSVSVFDSSETYEKDIEPPYVQYKVGSNWAFAQLTLNGDQYELEGFHMAANTEFVIRAGEDDWRHFSNYCGSSECVVAAAEDDNFKVTVDGDYNFYVKTGSKDVYITLNGEITAPYVMHGTDPSWTKVKLVENSGNTSEYMASIELAANEEFVICVGKNDWRHYESLKTGGDSAKVGPGSDANEQGTLHNLKALEAGTYTLYVEKNKSDSPTIYVTFVASGGSSVTTYTVSFDANGGNGTMDPVNNAPASYTLPANGFTAPSGQHFTGWKANNAGDLLAVGASYSVTANVTFYAQWADDAVENNVTLYLTANWSGWETPKAYVFDHLTETPKVAWPGQAMHYVGVNDDNDTIFSYTVDINAYDRIVFHNGNGGNSNQTVDIDISAATNGDAYYLKQHVELNDANKIEVEKWGTYTSAALTSKQIVYFTNNKGWSDVKAHIFKGDTALAEWPGVSMKWVANNEFSQGIYRILVQTPTYDSIIFNNNNNGDQTIDIALSILTGDNNAFFIEGDAKNAQGKWEVGQWCYNPLA